jgi:type IV pilus assembly protein PilM
MAKSRNKRVIGLVLGSAEMRAAELAADSGKMRVTAFGRLPLPAGLISDGLISDIPAAAALLGQLLKTRGFSGAPLLIGVKNQNVLLRMATFPKVPEDRMRNAILYQAQQFIPVAVNELVLDYVLCGEVPDSDPPAVNVLLVGAKKAFLDHVIEVVRLAGRSLTDIDSAQLALVRAASAQNGRAQDPILLADVDRESVSMTIYRGETVLMTRTVALPAQFLQAAGQEDPLPLDEGALEALCAQLVLDIGASVRYFATQRNEAVDSVLLTGIYDKMDRIALHAQEQLGISTRVFSPYPALAGVDTLRYAACISLALRGLEG